MQIKLGIDLGTSNIVAAYMQGDALLAHDWGDLGQGVLLPAVVQDTADKVRVGKAARGAWERGEPGCARRFKMEIGRDDTDQSRAAATAMGHMAAAIKHSILASDTHVSPFTEIEAVVITVPHGWSDRQRRETRAAIAQADLPVQRIISEPVAAAAYYAYARKLKQPEHVLVCDMGGGTFDITLTKIEPGRKIHVLERGTATNEAAGLLADSLIAAHIFNKCTGHPTDVRTMMHDHNNIDVRSLLQAVERARLNLNGAAVDALTEGRDPTSVDPEDVRFFYRGQRTSYELSYAEMAHLMQPVVADARRLIQTLLRALPQYKPNGVILAGGMSKMLLIQEAIACATDVPLEKLRNFGQEADRAIARGAALVAMNIIQVNEALPYSIGIVAMLPHTQQERNVRVLEQGTLVPCREESQTLFETVKVQTQMLQLKIALGESDEPQACDIIHSDLELNRSLPRYTKYRFVLEVDENLLLRIEAQREDSDRQFVTIDLKEASRGPVQIATLSAHQGAVPHD